MSVQAGDRVPDEWATAGRCTEGNIHGTPVGYADNPDGVSAVERRLDSAWDTPERREAIRSRLAAS